MAEGKKVMSFPVMQELVQAGIKDLVVRNKRPNCKRCFGRGYIGKVSLPNRTSSAFSVLKVCPCVGLRKKEGDALEHLEGLMAFACNESKDYDYYDIKEFKKSATHWIRRMEVVQRHDATEKPGAEAKSTVTSEREDHR